MFLWIYWESLLSQAEVWKCLGNLAIMLHTCYDKATYAFHFKEGYANRETHNIPNII